jgi:hypothetical protein
MYNTKKFVVGSSEVYEEIIMFYFLDDGKDIKTEDLIPERQKEKQELRFGEK